MKKLQTKFNKALLLKKKQMPILFINFRKLGLNSMISQYQALKYKKVIVVRNIKKKLYLLQLTLKKKIKFSFLKLINYFWLIFKPKNIIPTYFETIKKTNKINNYNFNFKLLNPLIKEYQKFFRIFKIKDQPQDNITHTIFIKYLNIYKKSLKNMKNFQLLLKNRYIKEKYLYRKSRLVNKNILKRYFKKLINIYLEINKKLKSKFLKKTKHLTAKKQYKKFKLLSLKVLKKRKFKKFKKYINYKPKFKRLKNRKLKFTLDKLRLISFLKYFKRKIRKKQLRLEKKLKPSIKSKLSLKTQLFHYPKYLQINFKTKSAILLGYPKINQIPLPFSINNKLKLI